MTISHIITKSILLGIALIISLPIASAQPDNAKIDSLKLALENAVEDTSKMNALSDLIYANFNSDIENSKAYAFQYMQLAENASEIFGTADSYLMLSQTYYRTGNTDSMKFFAQKALNFLNNLEKEELTTLRDGDLINLEAQAYSRLGIEAYNSGNYEMALNYYKEADSRVTDEISIGINQFNIGSILNAIGDYDGALKAFSNFREMAIRTDNKQYEAVALNNIGGIYSDLTEHENAIDYYNKALELKEEIGDEHGALRTLHGLAIEYEKFNIEKSLLLYESLLVKSRRLKNETYTTHALLSLMRVNIKLEDVEKVVKYREEAYEIIKDYPDGNEIKNSFFGSSSEFFFLNGEYSEALKMSSAAIKGYDILDEKRGQEFINVLQAHSKALYFTGNTAEGWKASLLRDSLITERNQTIQKEEIAAAEVKLRLREKELVFEKAEQESKLQVTKAEGRQNLFLSLFGAAGMLLILGFFFNRRTQKAKKEIEIQKNLVDQSLLEKEVLLKEIHHRVKNNLQIISSLLDEQARTSSDEQLKKMMREGQDRVQSMALIHQNLYQSDNLAGIEIKAYINELTKNIAYSQAGGKDVAIELNVNDAKLDIDTAIPIGLILNELITNCYKYAFAGKETGTIVIDFQETGDKKYAVKVKDNGIGLPVDFDLRKAKSLGMNLVEGLVRQLDGVMQFSSTGEGTEFQLQF